FVTRARGNHRFLSASEDEPKNQRTKNETRDETLLYQHAEHGAYRIGGLCGYTGQGHRSDAALPHHSDHWCHATGSSAPLGVYTERYFPAVPVPPGSGRQVEGGHRGGGLG